MSGPAPPGNSWNFKQTEGSAPANAASNGAVTRSSSKATIGLSASSVVFDRDHPTIIRPISKELAAAQKVTVTASSSSLAPRYDRDPFPVLKVGLFGRTIDRLIDEWMDWFIDSLTFFVHFFVMFILGPQYRRHLLRCYRVLWSLRTVTRASFPWWHGPIGSADAVMAEMFWSLPEVGRQSTKTWNALHRQVSIGFYFILVLRIPCCNKNTTCRHAVEDFTRTAFLPMYTSQSIKQSIGCLWIERPINQSIEKRRGALSALHTIFCSGVSVSSTLFFSARVAIILSTIFAGMPRTISGIVRPTWDWRTANTTYYTKTTGPWRRSLTRTSSRLALIPPAGPRTIIPRWSSTVDWRIRRSHSSMRHSHRPTWTFSAPGSERRKSSSKSSLTSTCEPSLKSGSYCSSMHGPRKTHNGICWTLCWEKNEKVAFKSAYTTPVTFDSEPSLRACNILQFPPAHTPPFGEKVHVKLVHYFPEEGRAVLRYLSAMEKTWEASASAEVKLIYAEAGILSSLEESWAKDATKFKPAEIVSVGNSYLYRHGEKMCRAEVASLGPLDEDSLTPKVATIELIDRGVEFVDVPVGEILQLPGVISVVAPKMVFSAVVHLQSGVLRLIDWLIRTRSIKCVKWNFVFAFAFAQMPCSILDSLNGKSRNGSSPRLYSQRRPDESGLHRFGWSSRAVQAGGRGELGAPGQSRSGYESRWWNFGGWILTSPGVTGGSRGAIFRTPIVDGCGDASNQTIEQRAGWRKFCFLVADLKFNM